MIAVLSIEPLETHMPIILTRPGLLTSLGFACKITGVINNLFGDIPDDTPTSRIKINMDGTGKVEFENPKSGDKLIVKHGNSGSNSGEK